MEKLNNNYYQPLIEEFHEGFMYEIKINDEWFKHEFSYNDFHPEFYVLMKQLNIF